jgi:hypothetical protein
MSTRLPPIIVVLLILILPGCKYQKGDMYTPTIQGDSLRYLILDKGTGLSISEKAASLKIRHESRGNTCVIRYISDSAALNNQHGVLLLNSTLPDVENDMLTKGFFGAFSTRQQVILLLVSYDDLARYFQKVKQ